MKPKMKEHPILFTGAMVRAILEGRKTETRRLVKLPLHCRTTGCELSPGELNPSEVNGVDTLCPYGGPRRILWVKETFADTDSSINIEPGYVYRATDPDWSEMDGFKWKPSIFMPRTASRITLEITQVRVERLDMITEEGAKAEGTPSDALVHYYCDEGDPEDPDDFGTHRCNWRYGYKVLWESINGKASWEKNPWVWVIQFRRMT